MKIKKSASALSRSMRIGIATITSTAMLGGVLVAVPAHPLLPTTAVAQAQENEQEAVATAHAQLINLKVLNLGNLLSTDDSRGVDGIIEAIEAEQNWANTGDNGQDADVAQLNVQLLGLLKVKLGDVTVPLISETGDSLLKGQAGLLSAYAHAESATHSKASAGTIGADGALSLNNAGADKDAALELDLTNVLGVELPPNLVDELSLSLGAIGASAEKNGTTVTRDYVLADAKLTLDAPVLGDVVTGLDDTLGKVGDTVNGLLPTEEVLKEKGLSGVLATIASGAVGLNLDLGVNVDLNSALQTLLREPLKDDDGLVSINLADGTIEVDLDKVHDKGINNLDPGTPLLSEAAINSIVETITNLLTDPTNSNGLIGKVNSLVTGDSESHTGGLYGTTVNLGVSLGDTGLIGVLRTILSVVGLGNLFDVLIGGFTLKTTVGGLLNDDIQATADPAVYAANPNEYVLIAGEGVVGGTVASVLSIVKGLLGYVGGALDKILFDEDGVLATLTAGLPNLVSGIVDPLGDALGGKDGILGGVAAITINEQEKVGDVYSVTALDVNVLDGAVHLPLASASVSAADTWQNPDPNGPTIAPISDQSIDLGESITSVTPKVTPADAKITTSELLPDGLKLEDGVISGKPEKAGDYEITVIATDTEGRTAKTTFNITVTDKSTPAEAPTIAPISGQTIDLGDSIAEVTPEVTPEGAEVSITGQPAGVTIVDGVISGTPTRPGNFNVTVTATNEGLTASTSFKITVTDPDSDVDAPTIAPIADAEGTEEKKIDPIEVEVTGEDVEVKVDGLPKGVKYDPENGEISGTPEKGTEGSYPVTVTATNDGGDATETFIFVVKKDNNGGGDNGNGDNGSSDNGSSGSSDGTSNGSSDFLQQCLDSPAAGVAGLLVALGTVGAIAGPALEPLMKSIGAELDRALRNLTNASSGANQPEWVRNINRGLNDAANAVDHRMVSQALFATAALALISTPVLCGMDNSSSSSS
ncbi:hypothetical protein YH66_14060 [[Brevibacterium] flavum]|uniref:Uncharacterized protein n=1 Tax=[Brevibacterium] flavum TaxID=92706 RepID=A0A0F6WRQ7_9CORY|nr:MULTISPECIES: choice-of-anchor G family protein [Corynebacterium]AKF28567.1 hypothetical protein YH66_14060 [[Brevibacterium] flavum]ANE09404.1 hypothetical protein A3654_14140 [Corynebacterium glutamicum]AST21814.1 hypothetical protein CEY17_14310 [Corynebacterium glutamicum ATCC 14067]KEI24351.1 hypothetical protein KIQ_001955 [Corynebacterium glutamicum ATCC 14067]KIH72446.1 hypothetical protein SD36_14105 [Corynebacterium glutamicum]